MFFYLEWKNRRGNIHVHEQKLHLFLITKLLNYTTMKLEMLNMLEVITSFLFRPEKQGKSEEH